MEPMGLIAGRGDYPLEWIEAARRAGVSRIAACAFEGETDPAIGRAADEVAWMRVGQLGRMLEHLKASGVTRAVMAGQIRPKNLFDLRPDIKALMLLARLPERNAETLFGAIANELAAAGIELAPATTFMEDRVPGPGWRAGPRPKARALREAEFGFRIAKEISRLDIGQAVVVKNGTVLAVEAFEGTNDLMRRGGALGHGGAVAVKVSKPAQDMRFDVPVIGPRTLEVAAESGIALLAIEARKTLILRMEALTELASRLRVSLVAIG
ncbi:MAG TPA: UDP-2,3-diacylglucosamine diphosphatase LpxI [Verrucomicrobiae bacterium]|nr:UDP-2,3-diacylglucosamine diphosphatase LpxI [Verrucomicrobiae bacterium]